MPDLNDILSRVMSDPSAMQQISQLAQSLGLQDGSAQQFPQKPPQQAPQLSTAVSAPSKLQADRNRTQSPRWNSGGSQNRASPSNAQPTSPLSSQDPSQLMNMLIQMSQRGGGDERQLALFKALKPFLRPERAHKLDLALQVAQMSRLAGNTLQNIYGPRKGR